MQPTSYNTTSNGRNIGFVKVDGTGPTVMFCTGFKSDMTGSKALALESFCAQRGQSFIRFDYSGHGVSSGAFEDGCIGDWYADALHVLDTLTSGPVVLVGSSMGAWIALLIAVARPERMAGFVGISSAPDFTEVLVWNQFTDAQKKEMEAHGRVAVPNCYGPDPYILTRRLVEEGRNHLLLYAPIAVSCPVRLLHGTADADVPWKMSAQILERVASKNALLTLIKDGNHRLSEPHQLELLCKAVYDLSVLAKETI